MGLDLEEFARRALKSRELGHQVRFDTRGDLAPPVKGHPPFEPFVSWTWSPAAETRSVIFPLVSIIHFPSLNYVGELTSDRLVPKSCCLSNYTQDTNPAA